LHERSNGVRVSFPFYILASRRLGSIISGGINHGHVDIRSANPSDLNELARVESSCFAKERYSRQVLRSLLLGAEYKTFLATALGEVIGAVTILLSEPFKHARLVSIATIPNHRNKGVARSLLKRAEEEAMRHGMNLMSLEVDPSNVPALNLYLHEGFEIKGTIADYYGASRDAFYMEKVLQEPPSE
jgi:ribosomal protein S18 acetylase RimI-like enzyme